MQKKSVNIVAQLEPGIKLEAEFQLSEAGHSGEKSFQKSGKVFYDGRTRRSDASSATRSQQWEEFGKFYRDRRLTDCLRILEQQGFVGDSAIFILALAGGEV